MDQTRSSPGTRSLAAPRGAFPWGRPLLAVLCVYFVAYAAWILRAWGGESDQTLIGDTAALPIEFAAALLAVGVSRLPTLPGGTRRAWLVLGLALLAYVAGDLLWAFYELVLGQEVPFPSLADVGYLGYYPLALVALLWMSSPFRDRTERRDFLLDAAIVVTAAFTAIWFLVLGPTIRARGEDLVALAVGAAYPLGDVVLMVGITSVALRRSSQSTRRALVVLLAAFAVSVVSDIAYLDAAMAGTYTARDPIDVGYAITWLLLAAAAILQAEDAARSAGVARPAVADLGPTSRRRLALLGCSALVGPGVLLAETLQGDEADVVVTLACWVVVVGLLIARMTSLVDDVRQRESRLRLLADHARDVLFRYRVSEPAGFDYVSPGVTPLTGYRPGELRNGAATALIHPDDRGAFEELARDDPERHTEPLRIRWLARDGSVVWTEQSATAVREADGSIVIEGVARDIGAQHAAEEALRESKERLRSVVTGAPIMLLATDTDGRLVLLEGQAVPSAGLQRGRDVGRPIEEVFAGEPEVVADVRRAMSGETFAATRTFGGSAFDARYTPLHDMHGRVAGVIAVATDISERERAERERGLLTSIIRQSKDLVLVVRPGGSVVYANAAFADLTGLAVDDVVGQHARALGGVFAGVDVVAIGERLRADREWTGRADLVHRDGASRQAELLVMPVHDGEGRTEYYVAIGRDVTHERELMARLEQAQKMEAVGQLAGGLAHDFNNLLTAVSGYAQLVQSSLPDDDPNREDVAEILKASDRAAALTRQLLAFSRRQVLQPRVLDLGSLIGDVERLLVRLLGEDIALVTSVAPGLGFVRADPGHLQQVLVNLAVNARDAMPSGGTLTIEAANSTLDDEFVRHHPGSFAGMAVRLSVRDTGTGMDAATVARVFEPFFTTKEQGRGTGLGLSMVYGIVKQSGGYIAVDSAPGVGSEFAIFLPVAGDEPDAVALPSPVSDPAAEGHGRVLVVEDDPSVRRLMASTLTRIGYRVTEAPDPETALRLVEAGGNFDLLITDVVMPGMSGPALAERMAVAAPALRTLFVSGYPREALGRDNVVDPSVAFLSKPFTADELSRMVRALLA